MVGGAGQWEDAGEDMKRVVMFSGGAGSWAAAKRVAERHGTADMVLLFTDTKTEDEDLYRFIDEAAADVGAPLVKIADGRTIWELFRAVRFLGNSQIAPCTTKLKRDVADKWLAENCDPLATVCYVGIDWTEAHRFDGTPTRKGLKRAKAESGWRFEAPMCEAPFVAKWQMLRDLDRAGIAPPACMLRASGTTTAAGCASRPESVTGRSCGGRAPPLFWSPSERRRRCRPCWGNP